eukprot:889493-Pyramimonas_sp.AAC.1
MGHRDVQNGAPEASKPLPRDEGGQKLPRGGVENRLGGDDFYEHVLAREMFAFAASDDDGDDGVCRVLSGLPL